jgi:hypothetical protein
MTDIVSKYLRAVKLLFVRLLQQCNESEEVRYHANWKSVMHVVEETKVGMQFKDGSYCTIQNCAIAG